MGFKRAKFESHTNRVTFETNAIRMTSSVQAQCMCIINFQKIDLSFVQIGLYYYLVDEKVK